MAIRKAATSVRSWRDDSGTGRGGRRRRRWRREGRWVLAYCRARAVSVSANNPLSPLCFRGQHVLLEGLTHFFRSSLVLRALAFSLLFFGDVSEQNKKHEKKIDEPYGGNAGGGVPLRLRGGRRSLHEYCAGASADGVLVVSVSPREGAEAENARGDRRVSTRH